MKENQQNLQATIMDRLVDDEPGASRESVRTRMLSIGQIKASVARDLENLLNTKRQIFFPPVTYPEVNNSLFVYGMRDFTSLNPGSRSVKQQLRQDVEQTIARFEPRLRNLTIQLETPTENKWTFRFRISALLVVEPLAEPVTFDTYFDVNRGEFNVSQ